MFLVTAAVAGLAPPVTVTGSPSVCASGARTHGVHIGVDIGGSFFPPVAAASAQRQGNSTRATDESWEICRPRIGPFEREARVPRLCFFRLSAGFTLSGLRRNPADQRPRLDSGTEPAGPMTSASFTRPALPEPTLLCPG